MPPGECILHNPTFGWQNEEAWQQRLTGMSKSSTLEETASSKASCRSTLPMAFCIT